MTEIISVYGFGSAFNGLGPANDTDILIVHRDSDPASCRFAIACKQRIVASVSGVDVTMLTHDEETYFGFIEEARATLLGTVREDHFTEDLSLLKRLALNAGKSQAHPAGQP